MSDERQLTDKELIAAWPQMTIEAREAAMPVGCSWMARKSWGFKRVLRELKGYEDRQAQRKKERSK